MSEYLQLKKQADEIKAKQRRIIAEKIADALFLVGHSGQAKRLVMERDKKFNGPGWCKEAVRDLILAHLETAECEKP